ncbi:MAG: helix-turn-helix domain-containing protein [Candidatus Symbiothrix sp.]|nr:helix-turn-helix domain-containing protein [Candidatus Symbiothrix sp.]
MNSFAQNPVEDSLLLKLPQLEGVARLKALHELQEQTLYQPKADSYNTLLLEEAQKQENNKYIAIALTNRVAYHRFTNNTNTLLYYSKAAEEFASKHKLNKDLFTTKQIVILNYMGRGYFSIGKGKAQEMYEEAKKTGDSQAIVIALLSLGDTYRCLGENDESICYIKEARNLYAPSEEAPYKILDCYLGLISANFNKQDKKEALLYMDSLRMEMARIKKEYPLYNLVDYELTGSICQLSLYIRENRLDEAWEKINELDKIMQQGEIPYYNFLLNIEKMGYYNARKDENKAEYYYNICYEYCMEYSQVEYIRRLLKIKAEFFTNKGWYRDAVETYKNLQAHIDSVNRESHLYEVEQIRIDYEVDKRENEIVQQKSQLQLIWFSTIVLTVFALALLVTVRIIWKNLKSIKRKNFLLFNQIKELTQTKMELLAFKDLMREKVDTSKNTVSDSPNSLFERVEIFMAEERPYINSEYGRKNLIADMNTNEVYLSKAIRSAVNMTIQEFINAKRMEAAKTLLLQDMSQTIETVAMDSGFATIRNFYRLFKEAYGMSPSDFRRYVNENYKS